MSTNYVLINKETKIVEDVVVWDGESWLPDEYHTEYDLVCVDGLKGSPVIGSSTYNQDLGGFVLPAPDDVEKFYLDPETLLWQLRKEFWIKPSDPA